MYKILSKISGGMMKEINFEKVISAVFIFTVLAILPEFAAAAFEFQGRGGRSGALGGAYTAISDDVEGMWWNPAGLRLAKSIQLDTSYTSLYGMDDLALMNAGIVVPSMSLGTWGFGYSSFGYSDYRETDLRLSFSAGLVEGVYFGTNLKSNSVSIDGIDNTGRAFGVDVGFLGNINENLRMGFSAYNINRPKMASDPVEYLQQRYMFGMYTTPVEGMSASLDFHKVPGNDWEHRLGLEFPMTRSLTLRTGLQTRPARFSFGFGFEMGIFNLNYAFKNHQALDFQHEFALQARFGGDSEESRRRGPAPEEEVEISGDSGPLITVNINNASIDSLTEVPGIGETTARDIVDYREETGEFRSVRDLMRVYGFTRNKYNDVKEYLTVDEETIIDKGPEPQREPEDKESEGDGEAGSSSEEIETPPEPEPEPQESETDSEEIEAPPEPEPDSEEEAPEETEDPETEEADEQETEKAEEEEEPEPEEEVEKFNLNQADVGKITGVSGINYSRARNLIRVRDRQGGFNSWDEVGQVSGMNPRLIENLKEKAVIE